jgi:excinuclease UvrABC helicase subunit UvrB
MSSASVDRNAHIPTEEIERDIADTEYEIETMQREEAGYRLVGDKLSVYRADARRDGIKRRQEFIAKLRELLKSRGVTE